MSSYEKMSKTKNILLNEKKMEYNFWQSDFGLGLFWPSIIKWMIGLNLLYGRFLRPLAFLFPIRLCLAKPVKWGHDI